MPTVSYSENKTEYMRQYRIENRERIKRLQREHYLKHKERYRERERRWKREHREYLAAYNRKHSRKWYLAHAEENRERARRKRKEMGTEAYRAYHRKMSKKWVDNAPVSYAKARLCAGTRLRASDIPLTLALAKQAVIRIRRAIDE